MSTCLQLLLAVKTITSRVGHLSPPARSLKLLHYCVFHAFMFAEAPCCKSRNIKLLHYCVFMHSCLQRLLAVKAGTSNCCIIVFFMHSCLQRLLAVKAGTSNCCIIVFFVHSCLQRLLAVKAGTSRDGHLSPSARSLKLLYYCVIDAFILIYILSSQK